MQFRATGSDTAMKHGLSAGEKTNLPKSTLSLQRLKIRAGDKIHITIFSNKKELNLTKCYPSAA